MHTKKRTKARSNIITRGNEKEIKIRNNTTLELLLLLWLLFHFMLNLRISFCRNPLTQLLYYFSALPFPCHVLYIYNHAQKETKDWVSSPHGIAQRLQNRKKCSRHKIGGMEYYYSVLCRQSYNSQKSVFKERPNHLLSCSVLFWQNIWISSPEYPLYISLDFKYLMHLWLSTESS